MNMYFYYNEITKHVYIFALSKDADRIVSKSYLVRKIRSKKFVFQNIRNELDIRTLIDFGYLPSDRDRADFNVNTYPKG